MKAINRLAYTISKGNKPNANDAAALNEIIDYVNKEKERELDNNMLFAKLYINAFKNSLIKNKGNYKDIVASLKSICRISFEDQLDGLVREANAIHLEQEIEAFTKDISKFKYPKYNIEDMKNKFKSTIGNLIEDFALLK